MYSIVIATVLTTGTPAPAFHGKLFGGGNNNNCIGNSCMGCSGCNGCGGCCGGYGFLGVRDYFADLFSGGCNGCGGGCMGCNGGCQGGGCMGCSGMSCMGCTGMMMSCMGCGGGYPMSYSMPMGGMPMSTSMSYEMPMGYPMMGQMPMGQMQMPGMYPQAPMTYEGTMPNPMATNPTPNYLPQGPMPQAYQAATPPNQTRIVVTLPADARLFVDGQQMNLTGAVRQFNTPDLKAGMRYAYTIKIEVDRGGKTVDQTQTVNLEPGKTAQVHFAEPGSPGSPNA